MLNDNEKLSGVTIIGGGIIGVCCALSLLERGCDVTIIDKNEPGDATSFGNAGVISHWSCVPQCLPGVWKNIPKWLLDKNGPLSFNLDQLPTLVPWVVKFLSNSKKNKVALIDCNSFYVSCERLFNPKVNNKPVVVLSNNDGCVISRSIEAKKIGIKMGEPYFKVKELVKKNKVHIFSSNYALYGDLSRRVMKTLKSFSDKIEIYSIDEAFVDLSHIKEEEVENYGKKIRERILKWTGIPTSVGIANTKTLSKVANHIAKKNKTGVTYLHKDIDDHLKNFYVSDIWGVGKQRC